MSILWDCTKCKTHGGIRFIVFIRNTIRCYQCMCMYAVLIMMGEENETKA